MPDEGPQPPGSPKAKPGSRWRIGLLALFAVPFFGVIAAAAVAVGIALAVAGSGPDEADACGRVPARVRVESPNGQRTAIVQSSKERQCFVSNYYDALFIADRSQEILAASHVTIKNEAKWLGNDTVEVRLMNVTWDIPQVAPRPLGVTLLFRLDTVMGVEFQRRVVRDDERDGRFPPLGPAHGTGMRNHCMAIREEWDRIRAFHAWARTNAEHGDPDPGAWVSEIYAQDCSALLQPGGAVMPP